MKIDNIKFDTHSLVKRLIIAGLKEPIAEEIVQVFNESRQFDISNLANKSDIALLKQDIALLKQDVKAEINESNLAAKGDIALLKQDIALLKQDVKAEINESNLAAKGDIALLKQDIALLKQEMKADIEKSKNESIKWQIGVCIALASVIIACFKFFAH